MKQQFFYTAKDGDPGSFGIRLVTRGRFSHVGAAFIGKPEEFTKRDIIPPKPNSDGLSRIYFESLWKADKVTGKSGVRGPYPVADLEAWVMEDPKDRHIMFQDLPDMPSQYCVDAMLRAKEAVGTVPYAPLQLLANLNMLIRGVGIPISKRSKNGWTCCEMCVRIQDERWARKYLLVGDICFDEYVPSGERRGTGLYELVQKASEAK